MDILNHALLIEGSIEKLAKALGIERNVIGNWRYRKEIPLPWQIALHAKYGKRKPRQVEAA